MKSFVFSRRPEFTAWWQRVLAPMGEVGVGSTLTEMPPGLGIAVVDLGSPGFADFRPEAFGGGACKVLVAGRAFPLELELELLSRGVAGCCPEALSEAACGHVLHVVANGGVWLSGEAIPVVIGKLRNLSARQREVRASSESRPDQVLTPREYEVARLVAEGASNKVIARTLAITDRTVKAHLTTIFAKLGVHDRLQLALLMTERVAP